MNLPVYARLFQALASENRMELLACLSEGEKTVTELVEETGEMQSKVSYHLKCLTNCGFVTWKTDGNRRIYSTNNRITDDLFAIMEAHIENHREGVYSCEILERGNGCRGTV